MLLETVALEETSIMQIEVGILKMHPFSMQQFFV